MIPLWQRRKKDVTQEEYDKFYSEKFMAMDKPLKTIVTSVEGVVTYKALLFIPSAAPYDYYTKEYKKGLQLYSSGVLIMDNCEELLPEHFRFVKGIVDSADLSLNISREMLQHDRHLITIAQNIEKKIKNELTSMLQNDRENYEKFFNAFGRQLKYGVVSDYGMHKEELQDLIMFYSSSEKKLVTLSEYVDRMKEDQKFIYFATGENAAAIDTLPQTELIRSKGYEILYCTEEIDEFTLQSLMTYKEKKFCSAMNPRKIKRMKKTRTHFLHLLRKHSVTRLQRLPHQRNLFHILFALRQRAAFHLKWKSISTQFSLTQI